MKCVFCEKFDGRSESVISFEPLNPVTKGHLLVVPRVHAIDFADRPEVSAFVMGHAALLAKKIGNCNIITSIGEDATQSIFHLHVHIIPRRKYDGLKLPWTGQRKLDEPPQPKTQAQSSQAKASE